MANIHVGDVGTRFIATITDQDGDVVNVSGASAKKIKFLKPDGTFLEKNADFFTDGLDGKLCYDAEAAFLSIAGKWFWQGYVVLVGGTWTTDSLSFDVKPVLAEVT